MAPFSQVSSVLEVLQQSYLLKHPTRWRSWAIFHALWQKWRDMKNILFCFLLHFSWLFSFWKIAEYNYLLVAILKNIWHVQTSSPKIFSNTYHTRLNWYQKLEVWKYHYGIFLWKRRRVFVLCFGTTVTKSHTYYLNLSVYKDIHLKSD